jgi:hypothetical protein
VSSDLFYRFSALEILDLKSHASSTFESRMIVCNGVRGQPDLPALPETDVALGLLHRHPLMTGVEIVGIGCSIQK